MVQDLSAGRPAWKQTNCSLALKFLFSQTENLLQINICSVSAWFLSNIDLLMRNTQLSAKPDCVIIIQRGSGYILCDGLAMAVGGPWRGSLVDPAQQSGGTWCKYWARGALQCWPRVLLQSGCYQCWTATGAPYHPVRCMTAVKSCYRMRGGSGGGAALGNIGLGGWIKRGIKHKEAEWENESEGGSIYATNSGEISSHCRNTVFKRSNWNHI